MSSQPWLLAFASVCLAIGAWGNLLVALLLGRGKRRLIGNPGGWEEAATAPELERAVRKQIHPGDRRSDPAPSIFPRKSC